MGTVILIIIFSLIIATILVFAISLASMIFLSSPYVPLKRKEIKRIYEIARVSPSQKVYDLGSGDGRILIYGVRNFGIQGKGCELILYPLVKASLMALILGIHKKVKFIWQNMYKMDINEADVVVCYLFPGAMKKLKNKFEKELKPSAKVIACAFPVPGWQHIVYDKPSDKNVGIYLYQR